MSDLSMNRDQTVSVGDWIVSSIITGIPIVGIVMLFVWAFGSDTKPSKKNWARAVLIVAAIGIVIYIVLALVFAAAFTTMYNNMGSSSL